MLVGIVTVGDTGIEWMNRSARRMFGGELADFIGAPISVVANDELDHPLRRTDYGETLEEGHKQIHEVWAGITDISARDYVIAGGTRNYRQGTGATGGDIGNRPEVYKPK